MIERTYGINSKHLVHLTLSISPSSRLKKRARTSIILEHTTSRGGLLNTMLVTEDGPPL